jgi:uracil-DNA glycosylase
MEEQEFYDTFYCASVTRCYPGRARSGGGDRTPTAREQELCSFWRDWEFKLLRPRLIVVVGGLAARRLLGLKSLEETIGRRFEIDESVAVPLPHPSGVSRWLNAPANQATLRKAVGLVHEELSKLPASP